VHIKHVHEFSKSFSSHRYGFDNRIQVWDSPVAMAGEISVVPASPGSREVKKNEIGVEFKATLSDREVYEAIYMRKIDNGTVVLEVCAPSPPQTYDRLLVHMNQKRLVSTFISLLLFLLESTFRL
jgi:hypothetical protein